jgi:hypothetical protein
MSRIRTALKGYYPLNGHVDDVSGSGLNGSILGTPPWLKNQAGKVVLDDTTAGVTHATQPTNSISYWKDGHHYAVVGSTYYIDGVVSSAFTPCVSSTSINCYIMPYHLWYPSVENLSFDGVGYTLLDTGTASVKYNLVGYNGAGAVASRTTIVAEGGTTVPAISYNNSRFFRGTTVFDNLSVGDYIESLFVQSPYVAGIRKSLFNSGDTASGFNIFPGSASSLSRIYLSIANGSNLAYTTDLGTSPRWLGLYIQSSSTVRFKISTLGIYSNTSASLIAPTVPLSVGSKEGASGSGGGDLATAPIGPIAHYRNITPTSYTTFLARRLARVQAGTWQPYILPEDLI